MEPWVEGYDMTGVSVSASDRAAGSPRGQKRTDHLHARLWTSASEQHRLHQTQAHGGQNVGTEHT